MRAHRGSSATDGGVGFSFSAGIPVIFLNFSYYAGSTVPPALVSHTPFLAFKFKYASRPIVRHQKCHFVGPNGCLGWSRHSTRQDRNSEKWVNKPTERRRHDVEQDADNGPQYRRKEGCWQIRLHEFRVAIQMRKDGESRRRHQPGYQGVKHYGRLLIHKTIVAERACEYYVGVIWLNLHYMFVRLCIKVDLTLRRTQPHRPSRKTSPSGVLPPIFLASENGIRELRRRLCRRRSGDGFPKRVA